MCRRSFICYRTDRCVVFTDRVGIMVCKWLYQMVHDTNAVAAFDYIHPLMVCTVSCPTAGAHDTLARNLPFHRRYACSSCSGPSPMSYIAILVNDNDDLSQRAELLLVRMCGVTPPRQLINPLLDAIFKAIQSSPVSRHHVRGLRMCTHV